MADERGSTQWLKVGLILLAAPLAAIAQDGSNPRTKEESAGEASRDAAPSADEKERLVVPDLFKALTEPPCSYCATQNRKGLIRGDDRVLAWIRATHNGGAMPIRHFLAAPRVINDTYGLFFYDPDGGYVAAYEKDYGYSAHGWRGGTMLVRGADGTLWSALSGVALEGPKRGERLKRIANFTTTWEHWMMLHPESTAYDLFDGKKYPLAELPIELSEGAKKTMGDIDPRLEPLAEVIGVEVGPARKAYPLAGLGDRAVILDRIGDASIAVFWYGPTASAVVFRARSGDRALEFDADEISPETAPFKDRETGTRWTLAGRAVDGELRGAELDWIPSIQCRWYAWVSENPKTELHDAKSE